MDDTAKYLIHASITADGVVERSDVVGAIFGQTEGLLGDDLDLRDLQQSSKVGRIDVEVSSEEGQSDGEITIATSLDKVETAILAASLETITRVGPCRARVEVTDIEDVREAKRREVVERAKELLSESFDDSIMTSAEILEEVRESVRIEDITEFEGFPAGPRVADSDAIIVVEGRADVLTLLRYGIKNAVAVEGTNVPDSVAELTQERTVTAFLDGDRGGELILRELAQVGDVDYVAFAPPNRSVEELGRREVMRALREKVPYDTLPREGSARAAVHASADTAEGPTDPPQESQGTTESAATPASEADGADDAPDADDESDADDGSDASGDQPEDGFVPADVAAGAETDGAGAAVASADDDAGPASTDTADEARATENQAAATAEVRVDDSPGAASDAAAGSGTESGDELAAQETTDTAAETETAPESSPGADAAASTLRDHVRAVIEAETGTARLLDDEVDVQDAVDAEGAFEAIRTADVAPYAVVLDGVLTQRVLDVAAQRGVEHVIARETGEFVKQPVDVRVRTVSQLVVE